MVPDIVAMTTLSITNHVVVFFIVYQFNSLSPATLVTYPHMFYFLSNRDFLVFAFKLTDVTGIFRVEFTVRGVSKLDLESH